MSRSVPMILLEDPRQGRLRRYCRPHGVIAARTAGDVAAALRDMEAARAAGFHLAGYFAYELGLALEQKLAPRLRPAETPLLWFGVFSAPDTIAAADAPSMLQDMCAGRAYAGPLVPEWDAAAYAQRFARAHALIGAGDIYQVNLSFRAGFAFAGDPLALYADLRRQAGNGHCAYVDDGERQFLSLSPELFFEAAADGAIASRPMKGTAPRSDDPADDAAARAALQTSAKDRAENLMIVDLIRNDLGRIAEIGSVYVDGLFTVETYPTVHQMVSTVRAQMRPGTGIGDIVKALFPCGSITGAPKIRAMEIIDELEQSPRGVYCGAIGQFAPDGSAAFNVAIRTLTLAGSRGSLGIGGAVVHDSTAAGEYAECLVKARHYEQARRPLLLIETLAHEPERGFVRLALHLARLQRSAAAFGLAFDRSQAMAVLNQAVRGQGGRSRVRLTLDEQGRMQAVAASLGEAGVWRYIVSPQRVLSSDPLQRHKTSWRSLYDDELARAAAAFGCDEVLFLNERGELAEGSRSNVFVVRDGVLATPPLSAGALDGCLRRELIESGACVERALTPADLAAGRLHFGNSLRGLIPAQLVDETVSCSA